MDDATKQRLGELEVLLGGVRIEVEHLNGDRETIKVRQVPLRMMPAYGLAVGDEGKLLEIYTAKESDWVDGLTQDSQEAIIEVGDRINLAPFLRWSERRLAATRHLQPMAERALASTNSLPPSVLAAVTPPISSES